MALLEELQNFRPDNHISLMAKVFGMPQKNIQTIGILVYDGVNELDMMGPRYVLGQAMGVKTQLLGTKAGPIRTVMGVQILPDALLDTVKQVDILVIPGGFKGTIEAVYDQKLHEHIRRLDQGTQYTTAVCTGGWVLGATGLLKGKRASTNWYREGEMLERFGAIPANERYTQDGKYWTSAGVTAGMDMSLAILEDIYGKRYAQAVMLDMEYDPAPPIKGGSPEQTEWMVNALMKNMYDSAIIPLMDSLDQQQATETAQ